MTVTAPGPVSATAALAKLALPLPQSAAVAQSTARRPDHVELSPPPTLRALWELAFTGAQHLDTLLPILARMLQAGEPMPLAFGHVARSIGDAAHQIDAGSADLAALNDPTRPGPEALDGWRQNARSALHDASELLNRAEYRLTPFTLDKNPEALWAMTQIVAAQRQVDGTLGDFSFLRRSRPTLTQPVARASFKLGPSIALLGITLLLLAFGLWLTAAGFLALGAAAAWLWRAVVTARNLRIELER